MVVFRFLNTTNEPEAKARQQVSGGHEYLSMFGEWLDREHPGLRRISAFRTLC
jgi:hypothetical protein